MSLAARLQRLDHVEEALAGAALVVVVLAVAWGVITRYVTAQPAPWTGEVAGLAFAWVVFLGAAAGFKRGLHVSIDLLVRRLPALVARPLARAVDVLVLVFAAYVVWLGIGFVQLNWDNPTPVLRWPFSIIHLAVTLGFASIALRQAGRVLLGPRPLAEAA